jgi:hypothetical protein
MTWPRCAGLRDQTPAPGRRPGFPHWGPAPLFSRARARRSEGPASAALLFASGCREVYPRRPSPARLSLSVFQRMAMSRILRTGLRVGPIRNGPTPRASVQGQPTGRWGRSRELCSQGSGSHNLERVEGSPTSVQPQVSKPRQCASTPPRLIDIFTKKAVMEPMKDEESNTCNKAMECIFNRLGIPETIYSDEGSEFTNKSLFILSS